MSLSPISPLGVSSPAVALPLPASPGAAPATKSSPDEVRRAAQQFEAILIRQLISPAVEPMMSSTALGGGEGGPGGAGGGVYSFLLTDVLSTAMSKGGGLGLAQVLQKQMSPTASLVAASSAHPLAAMPAAKIP